MTWTKRLDKFSPYSSVVLRLGLSCVLLWFGTSQILNPDQWMSYVPSWVNTMHPFSLTTFITINGSIEIIMGLCLLFGLFVRLFSVLFVLHMIGILIAVGYNEIGIRDFGLLFSGIALFLSYNKQCSIDALLTK